jgi:hypothetical protein
MSDRAHHYEEIPLDGSAFGRRAYREGRRLVEEAGLGMDELVWDCDEVLWDWLMDVSRMARGIPGWVRGRDITHREFFLVKPGIFELIWGMHHASLERGRDPYLRLWTNGYHWRLWRLAREIPGFAELLGPPADAGPDGAPSFLEHPRIFGRPDFVAVARELLDPHRRRDRLAELDDPRAHAAIEEQFARDPFDSSFKFPELAILRGKDGFERARYLVDDHLENVRRFVAPERLGVHVVSRAPRVLFGRIPNTVWRGAERLLPDLANALAPALAGALAELAGRRDEAPEHTSVDVTEAAEDYVPLQFSVEIPDERIREQWIEPMRALKRTSRRR